MAYWRAEVFSEVRLCLFSLGLTVRKEWLKVVTETTPLWYHTTPWEANTFNAKNVTHSEAIL